MNLLPQTYLLGLVGLLAIAAVVVGRQLLRVRRDESQLQQLEQSGAANNLGYAQDKLLNAEEALTLYRRTLEIEPGNGTAKRAVKKLEKRV